MALCRRSLLDVDAYANGRAGKRLTIAKLNARLCLAFSSTVSVPACAPTRPELLDLCGSPHTWTSQQLVLTSVTLALGRLRRRGDMSAGHDRRHGLRIDVLTSLCILWYKPLRAVLLWTLVLSTDTLRPHSSGV